NYLHLQIHFIKSHSFMKAAFKIFILLICGSQVYGQAPVTDISWLPSAGDKFYIYRITNEQTSDPTINPGDTRENVVWDFNHKNFVLTNPTDSITYGTPSSISITPVNPQANLAYGDSTNYICFIKNVDGLYLTEGRSTSVNNPEYPIYLSVNTNPRI